MASYPAGLTSSAPPRSNLGGTLDSRGERWRPAQWDPEWPEGRYSQEVERENRVAEFPEECPEGEHILGYQDGMLGNPDGTLGRRDGIQCYNRRANNHYLHKRSCCK